MNNPEQRSSFYRNIESPSLNMPNFRSAGPTHNEEAGAIQKLLGEISSGLRILEDRYYNLRKKSQMTDQNLLEAQRTFEKEKRILAEEILETKTKLQDFMEDLQIMKGELKETAKHNDLIVIEKYLDMWEPMQFVTRREVEELFEDDEK